ncbi:apyrase-like [Culex pipiens pallens]|uniref:apyrase-like n=1 Tax=Culex pipiens pallens TaxID=42434 RepID=UPI001953DDDA|nr:apyrase-like [Culex pipiens pallens]
MGKPVKCSSVILIIIGFFTSLTESVDNLPANGDLSNLFPLTLIHNNDFHARYEETNLKSKACSASDKQQNKCIAGIARLQTVIQNLRKQYASKNALYLNIGDNYQGTLWYNLLRWKVTAHFVKLLKPDAMTLGNHEFDHRPEGLRPYLKVLREAGIRTVVANLELNGEPNLKALPKSITIKVQNRWIGLIGVLYDKTHEIAMTGKVTLSNAVQAVKAEASRLKAKGIQIIVVMSHCSFEEDKRIAAEAGDDIDVIVGAHSHSFLYSRESGKPYDKGDTIEGEYPEIVNSSSSGRSIPIVQAKAFGKYVGRLTLYFDKRGEVKHWEGYPVYVKNSIKPDETILQELIPWRQKVEKLGSTEIGSTEIHLDRESCRKQECTLGVLMADSFVDAFSNASFKPLAMIQAGNFRNPIPIGKITNGDVIEAAPYGSTADMVKLKGEDIMNMVEHSFTLDDENRTNCLQTSGFNVVVDLQKSFNNRILKIEAKNYANPKSEASELLDPEKFYYVVTTGYLANGKDGFIWMKKAVGRWTGPLDSDALTNYVKKIKKVNSKNLKMNRLKICGIGYKGAECSS